MSEKNKENNTENKTADRCDFRETWEHRLREAANGFHNAHIAFDEALRRYNSTRSGFINAIKDGLSSKKMVVYLLTDSDKIATIYAKDFLACDDDSKFELRGHDTWSGYYWTETLRISDYDKLWSFNRSTLDVVLEDRLREKKEAKKKKDNDILTAKRMMESLKEMYNIDDERLSELLPYFQAKEEL